MHRPTEVNTTQDFTQSHTVIPSTHLLTARRKCSTTVYKDLSRNHGYLVDQYTINNTCKPAYKYPGWTEARWSHTHSMLPEEKLILTLDFSVLQLQILQLDALSGFSSFSHWNLLFLLQAIYYWIKPANICLLNFLPTLHLTPSSHP